jgi:hypothetical protein
MSVQPTAPKDQQFQYGPPPQFSFNEAPPPYEVIYSAPQNIVYTPPPTFNFVEVPKTKILVRNECPPYVHSTAVYKTTAKGVETFDNRLDSNSSELWNFFMTHVEAPPEMDVVIQGTHQETETYTTTSENNTTQVHTRTITVVDFCIRIGVSHYVNNTWHQIAVSPEKDGITYSFQQVLDLYTKSESTFKKITLGKVIDWDFDHLKIALFNLVRPHYRDNITIAFEQRKNSIKVVCGNGWSAISENGCVRCLCVVSCLWIIFYPIYCCMRTNINRKINANYKMNLAGADFYQRNAATIVGAVHARGSHTWRSA